MKVFKVVRTVIAHISINDDDASDLEAWEDAIGEDGNYDLEKMAEMVEEDFDDSVEPDNSSCVVTELIGEDLKSYLADQPVAQD